MATQACGTAWTKAERRRTAARPPSAPSSHPRPQLDPGGAGRGSGTGSDTMRGETSARKPRPRGCGELRPTARLRDVTGERAGPAQSPRSIPSPTGGRRGRSGAFAQAQSTAGRWHAGPRGGEAARDLARGGRFELLAPPASPPLPARAPPQPSRHFLRLFSPQRSAGTQRCGEYRGCGAGNRSYRGRAASAACPLPSPPRPSLPGIGSWPGTQLPQSWDVAGGVWTRWR